jgi:hypothetical protein
VLNNNATILFTGTTTLNIQWQLRAKDHVAIFPAHNLTKPSDLTINYRGVLSKHEEHEQSGMEDDDDEIDASFDDENDRNNWKKGKLARPILFGDRSFLNFILNAPSANVIVGNESILRGQVVGRRVAVGRGTLVSRNESFAKESDPAKVVEQDGVKFIGNEVLLGLTDDGLFLDAQEAAQAVGGRVVGFDPNPPLYQILLPTSSVEGIETALQTITNLHHPRIVGVSTNYILE